MTKTQKEKCKTYYDNPGLVNLLTKLGRGYFNLKGDVFNDYAMSHNDGRDYEQVQRLRSIQSA
jgi:hypothetical protein